jgi:hypothetical protein
VATYHGISLADIIYIDLADIDGTTLWIKFENEIGLYWMELYIHLLVWI